MFLSCMFIYFTVLAYEPPHGTFGRHSRGKLAATESSNPTCKVIHEAGGILHECRQENVFSAAVDSITSVHQLMEVLRLTHAFEYRSVPHGEGIQQHCYCVRLMTKFPRRGHTTTLPLRHIDDEVPRKGHTTTLQLRHINDEVPRRGHTTTLPLRHINDEVPRRWHTTTLPLRHIDDEVPHGKGIQQHCNCVTLMTKVPRRGHTATLTLMTKADRAYNTATASH